MRQMTPTILSLQTELEAAKYLNVSHRTLQKLRVVGGGPKFIKLGRKVRYRLADLVVRVLVIDAVF